ncbi:MAG: alpha/beta hydrolase [Rikenellaceae bacterium]
MKKLLTAILILISANVMAKDYGADRVISLWDNSSAPHSNGLSGEIKEIKPDRPTNITEARLLIFEAEGRPTGQAVVICPGGGYRVLSMDEEGSMMAEWLNTLGVSAAVLQYRTPNGVGEVPLEDAERALEVVRDMAAELKIDPTQVGIYGASAGGHLAAAASTMLTEDKRPNFTILFYPVITSDGEAAHKNSYNNLLGKDRTESLSASYSPEKRVDRATPAAIIFLCDDDKTVNSQNSTIYYNALKRNGVAASLHIYPEGGHGWGNSSRPSFRAEWQASLAEWLEWLENKNNKTDK